MFITVSAICGTLFIGCMIAAIIVFMRRQIDDLFMKYAMRNLIVALFLTTIMCFIITSYSSTQYLNDQTVYGQQVYFELPFYQFLIVIAAVLFNYEEMYQELNLMCQTEDGS